MKKSNIIATIVGIAGIIITLWLLASWIDIISDNMSQNPQHASWNIFSMITSEEVR